MNRISKVKVLLGYRLHVEFEDGASGIVDLAENVGKGVFAAWRDSGFFEQVAIGSAGELVWGDKIDLCPDALYLKNRQETGRHLSDATQSARPCLRSAVGAGASARGVAEDPAFGIRPANRRGSPLLVSPNCQRAPGGAEGKKRPAFCRPFSYC